ncbi:transposase [Lignipirellula cremea]|uniref:Transposase IS4-like domain-containing protein n=1 Tax=Lignipirellula cremea TaxID=2528010 RepID=A0A518DSM5_9BACT|nr:transposase [Lignipirellula cremea]QDU92359.1 hypothetical protein Pla8534_01050 [Lignipirellula cremea]QDU92839.1 hypothetical protein Pla8534_06120 [Lignipirellula cremea]QDU93439.1 hypothetical protein Pla8534_12190 [Lignipirellula cremea]QDU94101.1 hypothetical protein Pla8534_18870 [Lignipirellula cremea]QDU94103.1 hypothetical protein Pla8534_18890 [Lignipirellula cremea]
MILGEVFARFEKEGPIPVMTKAALGAALTPDRLDQIFADHAVSQRVSELSFSVLVNLMGMVVAKTRKSTNAAYQACKQDISVSVNSVYDKLNGVEPLVSAALVRETATLFRELIEPMNSARPSLLPGYRVRILDGNHPGATQHRIQELRTIAAGPLPGVVLAVLDPQLGLIDDVELAEDGHAQERSLLIELINRLVPGEVWVADRNFCTSVFLQEIALNEAFFVIRQHAANVRWKPTGDRVLRGESETGQVFEQSILITDDFGAKLPARRISVELFQSGRGGEQEIHILSNLPADVDAVTISDTYRTRWSIEAAFNELRLSLNNEINTLGYPPAALFGFSLGLVIFNALAVVKAALRAAHGVEKIEKNFSFYYMADEMSMVWRGMMIAIPEDEWREALSPLTLKQLSKMLVELAGNVRLSAFQKHKRGPKRPPPKRTKRNDQPHVSTAKILAKRKKC